MPFRKAALTFITAMAFFFQPTGNAHALEIPIPDIPPMDKNPIMLFLAEMEGVAVEGRGILKKESYSIPINGQTWRLKVAAPTKIKFLLDFSQESLVAEKITLAPKIRSLDVTLDAPIILTTPSGLPLALQEVRKSETEGNLSVGLGLAVEEALNYILAYTFHSSEEESVKEFESRVDKMFSRLDLDRCTIRLKPGAQLDILDSRLALGPGNTLDLKGLSLLQTGEAQGRIEMHLNLGRGTRLALNEQSLAPRAVVLKIAGSFTRTKEELSFSATTESGTANKVVLSAGDGKTLQLSGINLTAGGSLAPNLLIQGWIGARADAAGFGRGPYDRLIRNAGIIMRETTFTLKESGLHLDLPDIQIRLDQNDVKNLVKMRIDDRLTVNSGEFHAGAVLGKLPINYKGSTGKMKAAVHIRNLKKIELYFKPDKMDFHVTPDFRIDPQVYVAQKIKLKKVWPPKVETRYHWVKVPSTNGQADVNGVIRFGLENPGQQLSKLRLRFDVVPGEPNIRNFPDWAEKNIKPGGKSVRQRIKEAIRRTIVVVPFSGLSGEAKNFFDRFVVKGFRAKPVGRDMVLTLRAEYSR